MSPGPDHYNIMEGSVRPREKSYSIGRASLNDRGQLVPFGELGFSSQKLYKSNMVGPGSYSQKDDIVRIRFPSNSIPRASRMAIDKNFGPSPADYNPENPRFKRVHSVVFNKSNLIERDEHKDEPGPGAYDKISK